MIGAENPLRKAALTCHRGPIGGRGGGGWGGGRKTRVAQRLPWFERSLGKKSGDDRSQTIFQKHPSRTRSPVTTTATDRANEGSAQGGVGYFKKILGRAATCALYSLVCHFY
jgi:hypothetical protein